MNCLYGIGQKVKMLDENGVVLVAGKVRGILIKDGSIQYLVSYWDDKKYVTEWIYEDDLDPA